MSTDVFLGLPFNIASYNLLLLMLAQVTGKVPGRLIWTGGDIHLYNNHLPQAREMLTRSPLKPTTIELNSSIKNIDDFTYEDINLVKYNYYPSIKGEISV